jgi:hypothetical protein
MQPVSSGAKQACFKDLHKAAAQKKQLAARWRGNRLRREEERHRDPTQPPSLFGKLWGYYEIHYRKRRAISQYLVIDKIEKSLFILDKTDLI